MIEVFQTKHGKEDGNCMEACVASLLELELDQIPLLNAAADGNWADVLNEWLKIVLNCFYIELKWNGEIPEGYCIIVGESPRYKGQKHAVVGFDGKIVHDPVGKRSDGYMTLCRRDTWQYGYFIPCDPMAFGDLFLKDV